MLHVLASASGALLGWATDPAQLPPAPASSVVVLREAWEAPPPLPYVWSPAALDWVIPAPVGRRMSAGDFARRIGFVQEKFLQSLKYRADIDAETKGAIDTLLSWLQRVVATGVRVDDPVTIDGSHQIGALLEAMAPQLIPQGRAAYVASLLAPVP